MTWDQRIIQLAAVFNVFFSGRAIMHFPDPPISPAAIGWIVIAMLVVTGLTLIAPQSSGAGQ